VWGWIAWILVALAVWVTVAAFVGVLLGRVVRRRDQQTPTAAPDAPPPPPRVPVQPPLSERRPRSRGR
jgi:hypothetical protein